MVVRQTVTLLLSGWQRSPRQMRRRAATSEITMVDGSFRRFLAVAALSLTCGMFHPTASRADTSTPEVDRTGCVVPGETLYISGLILQGGDNSFYLWTDKPTCVASESGEDENWVVRTQLIELQCHDDSWNGHERRRGETTEFRGEIWATAPDRVYLRCHMPIWPSAIFPTSDFQTPTRSGELPVAAESVKHFSSLIRSYATCSTWYFWHRRYETGLFNNQSAA